MLPSLASKKLGILIDFYRKNEAAATGNGAEDRIREQAGGEPLGPRHVN